MTYERGAGAASGSGTSGVTVKDEGVALATAGDTLDFVGAGVTATGAAGTKTITIPGGGGAMEVIARTVVGGGGAASIDFTSIPATYESLVIDIIARSDNAGASEFRMRFNNDSSAAYDYQMLYAFSGTAQGILVTGATYIRPFTVVASGAAAGQISTSRIVIPGYARTTFNKGGHSDGGSGPVISESHQWQWQNTAAIDRVTLFCDAGNLIAGCMAVLYGVKGA